MRRSDLLPPISPRFVAFAWRYHPLRRSLLPAASTRGRGLRGVVVPVPEPELLVETAGSLRFLGNPCVPMPCSWTPVGPRTPGHCGASTWPPLVSTTKAPAMSFGFGARSHGLGTGCLRFVLAVTRHDARLTSGCLAQLGRAGFCDPQGCDERFPSSSLIPLSQAYPDAMTPLNSPGGWRRVAWTRHASGSPSDKRLRMGQ